MVIANLSGEKIIYPDQKIDTMGTFLRVKKSAITLAKTGGVTVLFALIPVLHFVLVPVGLLVTLLSTWSAWNQAYYLPTFEVHCPTCDKKSPTALAGAELPLRTYCPQCRNLIYITNS